jgi:ABC-type multidrug transport system fused ATPase/permease subunit
MFLIGKIFIPKIKLLQKENRDLSGNVYSLISIFCNHILDMRASQLPFKNKIECISSRESKKRIELAITQGIYKELSATIRMLIYIIVPVISCYGIARGTLSFGIVAATFSLLGWIVGPFMGLSGAISEYTNQMISVERVFELYNKSCEDDEFGVTADSFITDDDVQSLTINNIKFAYPDSVPVLDRFCLKLKKGDVIHLSGSSGSGKSTVIKLIMKFYQPAHGEILINDKSQTTFLSDTWRHYFAYIPQQISIIQDTLRTNILLGRENISDQQLTAASSISGLYEIIDVLPNGLETRIGTGGVQLSGGQLQRVGIARALLQNAPIYLFDEATAGFDTETHAKVFNQLTEYLKDKIILYIIHREDLGVDSNIINIDNSNI